MSCEVGEVTERLENEQSSFFNPSVALPTSQLILQPFHCFTYVTTHSPTLPSLYLRHSSFSNPSVASPTSKYILQPFFCFSYVTSSSLNSPGESPMPCSIITESLYHHVNTLYKRLKNRNLKYRDLFSLF